MNTWKLHDQSISNQAQQLLKRLESLDTSFKTHQFAILDALEDEQVEAEQDALDKHDDDVMSLSIMLQALTTPTAETPVVAEAKSVPDRTLVGCRLAQLQARLVSVTDEANTLSGDPAEIHLVYTYQELLADLKVELTDVRKEVLVITPDTSDSLSVAVLEQDKDIFDLSVKIKKLLYNPLDLLWNRSHQRYANHMELSSQGLTCFVQR